MIIETKDEKLEKMLTDLDPPYESIEEMKIGRLLDKYSIPFFYRQPTIIYNEGKNEVWKPSFTMYSYGGAVIDYVADKGDIPGEHLLSKDRIYRYNQVPAVLLGPKDLEKPKWEENLYKKLKQIDHKAFKTVQYTP